MADIDKKLGHLLARAGVSPPQFANDLHALFKTRKDLVDDWLTGSRTPHRSSLAKIAGYWSARFPGIEANWFDADLRQFKALLEKSLAPGDAQGTSGQAASRRTSLDLEEGRALAGTYRVYRRDARRPELVHRETLVLNFQHNRDPQLLCTYLANASLFDRRPETYSGRIIHTEQSYHFVGAREGGPGAPLMTFATFGRDPFENPPIKNGILLGVVALSGTAFASALILEKRQGGEEESQIAVLKESDVQPDILARLPSAGLLQPPP